MKHLTHYCSQCGKKEGLVVLKPTYTYTYEREEYQAYDCQYCRARDTKWKNKMSKERRKHE